MDKVSVKSQLMNIEDCITRKSTSISLIQKIFNAHCTTYYVLNSGISEPNLTKFLQGVQKWLPITLLKSKLRSSNSFGNANVTNEDRRQIAGDSRQKLRILTA